MLQLTTVDTGSVSHVPVQVNMHHNIDAINNCHSSSENVPGDIDQSIFAAVTLRIFYSINCQKHQND